MVVCTGVLAALTAAELMTPQRLLAVAMTMGVSFAFSGPASMAIAANAVPSEDLASAVSLQSAANNLTRVMGPLLAAPLLALGRFELSFADGGRERRDSVRAGLAQIGNVQLIAIHDAARPFVSPRLIDDVVAAAARHGAALPAVAATDTVKLRDDQGFVDSTVPRQRVWLAQTPQIFRADWIRRAHEEARTTGAESTDDAMLVEQLGLRVHLVSGDPTNRKITTPEDREWAEWWLSKHPAPR